MDRAVGIEWEQHRSFLVAPDGHRCRALRSLQVAEGAPAAQAPEPSGRQIGGEDRPVDREAVEAVVATRSSRAQDRQARLGPPRKVEHRLARTPAPRSGAGAMRRRERCPRRPPGGPGGSRGGADARSPGTRPLRRGAPAPSPSCRDPLGETVVRGEKVGHRVLPGQLPAQALVAEATHLFPPRRVVEERRRYRPPTPARRSVSRTWRRRRPIGGSPSGRRRRSGRRSTCSRGPCSSWTCRTTR